MISADVLRNLASDLRDAIVLAYQNTPLAPEVPDVQIKHGIAPPHDCPDTCFVSYEVVQRASQGTAERCAFVPQVRFHIEVIRCWPGEADPRAEEEAAQGLNDDATTLLYGLTSANYASTLFPSFPALGCEGVRFEDMRPREPQGGIAGWVWRVTVDLAGRPIA